MAHIYIQEHFHPLGGISSDHKQKQHYLGYDSNCHPSRLYTFIPYRPRATDLCRPYTLSSPTALERQTYVGHIYKLFSEQNVTLRSLHNG